MEVTKDNFNELLPSIKEAIDGSTFVAIDCELTGLVGRQDGVHAFDTQKEYYEKTRYACHNYLIIQYGICCFKYDAENNNFKHEAYNFYVFQRPINRFVPDRSFFCQSSSIDFLVNEGFDFNKLFKKGISYLNIADEMMYKEKLADAQKNRADGLLQQQNNQQQNLITIPPEDQPFIDSVFETIEEFLKSDNEEVVLPKCNAFLRRLIYQTAEGKSLGRFSIESRVLENKDRVLVATKPKSLSTKLEENSKKEEVEKEELENSIGFSKVIRYLAESKKLIVGHNMLLDLLHTIDKFLAPLPETYEEFKDFLHSWFPKILDTKHLCSSSYFKDHINSSVLSHLLESVQKEPFEKPNIEVEDKRKGYNLGSGDAHVAAYDAFITGYALIALWKRLGVLEKIEQPYENSDLLEPYSNRLHLMRLIDCTFIHLGEDDAVPSRDHVFYMTFPKEWKTNDIMQLFSPFGGVQIGWVDDSSAYVGLVKKDNVAVAFRTLSQSDTYSIIPYARRQAQLEGQHFPLSPSLRRRKKSLESMQPSLKRRKTNSFGESSGFRRSFDTIKEKPEMDLEDALTLTRHKNKEVIPIANKPSRKRTLSKNFQEDDRWE